jgi:hypothetical protein
VIKNDFALSKRVFHDGKDMGSMREHLIAHNPSDPRIAPLDIDDQYYMWVFEQLSRSRPYEQGHPLPISLSTFRDYMTLFNDELDEKEILLLQSIDDAFVSELIKNNKEQ